MLTTKQMGVCIRGVLYAGLLMLLMVETSSVVHAQDASGESTDESLSKELMDEVAGQIEKFCKAHKVTTLQVVDFQGTVGARATAEVKQDWLDSLKECGISVRATDSTHISGRIQSQQAGDTEIILLMCTLSDSRGADIRTFRVRKVVSITPLS
ncbi:MAG: hypothetical protein KDA86_13655 [Planctomycetaceae bacterium]|nr:hypothetical protein [Planctomycetaceae bacterium]